MQDATRGTLVDLRPVREADLDQFDAWEADPDYDGEYNGFTLKLGGSMRRAFAERRTLEEQHGTLVIVTKAGEVAGSIDYRPVPFGPQSGNRAYEIGITIAPAHRGRGYGSEAQRLLAAYLFAAYPIERVQASTDSTNLAEQRALERAGFRREGVLRRAQFRAGGWHDLVLFSKLRGEP